MDLCRDGLSGLLDLDLDRDDVSDLLELDCVRLCAGRSLVSLCVSAAALDPLAVVSCGLLGVLWGFGGGETFLGGLSFSGSFFLFGLGAGIAFLF